MNNLTNNIYRGNIDMIILSLLYEEDSYGYKILKDVNDNAAGSFELKRPTLYSALKRLEKKGFVKSYLKEQYNELGGQRKYYTLTQEGKEEFEKNKDEWDFSKKVINDLSSTTPSIGNTSLDNQNNINDKEPLSLTQELEQKLNQMQQDAQSEQQNIEDIQNNNEINNENNKKTVDYDKYYVKGILTTDIFTGKSILDKEEDNSDDESKYDKYYVKGQLDQDIYTGQKKIKPSEIANINKESDDLMEEMQNLYEEPESLDNSNSTENFQYNSLFSSNNDLANNEEKYSFTNSQDFNYQDNQTNFNQEPNHFENINMEQANFFENVPETNVKPIKNILDDENDTKPQTFEEIERSNKNEFPIFSDDIPTTNTSMFDKDAIQSQLEKLENNEEDLYPGSDEYDLDNYKPKYIQQTMDLNNDYVVGAVDHEEEYTREKDYKEILGGFLADKHTVNKPISKTDSDDSELNAQENTFDNTNNQDINLESPTEKEKNTNETNYSIIDYTSLKSELLVEGVKLKEYQETLQGDQNIIWKNKLLFFTLMTISFMMISELFIIYLTCKNIVSYTTVFYGVFAGILLIPFIIGTILFIRNPKYKIKDRFYLKRHFIISIIVFFWLVVSTILLAMILKINFANFNDILTYIIFPVIFLAHYPIGILIYTIYKKTKMVHVNKQIKTKVEKQSKEN